MKPDRAELKRAVAKKRSSEAVAGDTAPKRARLSSPREESDGAGAGPSAPEAPSQEPTASRVATPPEAAEAGGGESAMGVEAPSEATGATGGAESTEGAAAAESESPPPGHGKGKAPASGGIDPLRRSRRREAGAKYVELGISWEDEGLENPQVAGRLLEVVRLGKDWEKMKARPFYEMADESDCTLYKVIHEHALLKGVAVRSSKRMSQLSTKLKEVVAERDDIKKTLEAREEADVGLKEALRSASQECEALKGALGASEEERKALRAELKSARRHAKEAASKAKKKLQAAEGSRDAAVRRREDDILLAGVKAINEYKASKAFREEMTEAGTSSYLTGIEVTIERVLRRYPGLDLADIESDVEEEGAGLDDQGVDVPEEGELVPPRLSTEGPAAEAASEEIDVVAIGEAAVESIRAPASEDAS